MINLLKKLFAKKANPVSYIGKTEVKPAIDPLLKKNSEPKKSDSTLKSEVPKIQKNDKPVSKPATANAKKPGRPKGQPSKKPATKSTTNKK